MWKAVLACVIASAGPAAAQSVLAGGSCPMIPEGAKLVEVDTPDGGALDFTITGDPAILRARVHMLAEAHNQMPERMTIVGHGPDAREQPIVLAHAMASDTPTGARLFLSADDPAQINQLRRQVRDKVASCKARNMP
jgi:hypothetical protein